MVAAKLQHPGILFRRLSRNRNVVKIFAEDRFVSLDLENLVAFHNLLNFLKTLSTERGRDQSQSGRTLSGIQFFEAEAGPGNERPRGNWLSANPSVCTDVALPRSNVIDGIKKEPVRTIVPFFDA